ncbi:MAG: type II toxin-antitoxin system RelE/ParE family toxin [Candidatus Peribacteraceae bacterium]|jgi:mRNA-degrading endonuclease RelE of RelBE toxin-antitoxin system|nr:type II toxin-antitoxin system RelE/ParE family toxin [Candidatus Peribacteraceae bacterium]
MNVVYTPDAEEDINRLEWLVAQRIVAKVDWFASQNDPLHFAVPLTGARALYRFRIGDYRAFFTVRRRRVVVLLVLAVKHRSEAYR